MTSLMPTTKTWTSGEGVLIEMITYKTQVFDRIMFAMEEAFSRNEAGSLPDTVAAFIICAAVMVRIDLPPENAPEWAKWLHNMVSSPTWRRDPAKDYLSLDFAPVELLDKWYEAYQATRDDSHAAPPALQTPPPSALPTGEEDDQTAANPTASGGPSLTITSSPTRGKRSIGRAATGM